MTKKTWKPQPKWYRRDMVTTGQAKLLERIGYSKEEISFMNIKTAAWRIDQARREGRI